MNFIWKKKREDKTDKVKKIEGRNEKTLKKNSGWPSKIIFSWATEKTLIL